MLALFATLSAFVNMPFVVAGSSVQVDAVHVAVLVDVETEGLAAGSDECLLCCAAGAGGKPHGALLSTGESTGGKIGTFRLTLVKKAIFSLLKSIKFCVLDTIFKVAINSNSH